MNPNAEFDIIVYGSTGFTGRLVAEYLQKEYGADDNLKWAMAGRSMEKLQAVRAEMEVSDDVPLIVADAQDTASLQAMATRAKCVITTVGPYTLYGEPLVAACAKTGTDYVDLSGEPLFMRAMIEQHSAAAKDSGARIVHSCGFDSIPFDLGVYYLQEEAKKKFGHTLPRVKGRMRKMQGTFSGGTAASLKETMKAVQADPSVLEHLRNPFSLTEGFEGPEQPHGMAPMEDEDLGMWTAPFVMAPINTKNVHRSNALLNHAYGKNFVYDEMVLTGPGEQGKAAAEAMASAPPMGADGGPKPGEGPSKAEREAGHYDALFVGLGTNGERIDVGVTGDKDPGYGSTSKMIAESAICLTQECADLPGGIYTPAPAMGMKLIQRLRDHAGLTFTVES